MPDLQFKDCIVIGAGPAGMTAALYLNRFHRDVTVFDAGNSRAHWIPKTHNLLPRNLRLARCAPSQNSDPTSAIFARIVSP